MLLTGALACEVGELTPVEIDYDMNDGPETPSGVPPEDDNGADEITIAGDLLYQPLWRCGTPTPIPTACYTVEPPPTYTPPATPQQVCNTPEATATTMQLVTDFPLGKHIQVGPIGGAAAGLWVWIDHVDVDKKEIELEDGQKVEIWVATWDLTVQNASTETAVEFYPLAQSYVYETRLEDGTTTRDPYPPTFDAMTAVGIIDEQYFGDGEYDEDDLGGEEESDDASTYILAPGKTITVELAAFVPGPEVLRVAYTLAPNSSATDMNEQPGTNDIIWSTEENPDADECPSEITPGAGGISAGDPIDVGDIKLAGTPIAGMMEDWIVRGYGCTPYFTGEVGSGCPGDAPWWHNGLDIDAPEGTEYLDTLPNPGEVVLAGADVWGADCSDLDGAKEPTTGLGYVVVHRTYIGDKLVTVIGGHLSAWNVGYLNLTTASAQVLGLTGSTGCSTGPHLHFAVMIDNNFVDPLYLFP